MTNNANINVSIDSKKVSIDGNLTFNIKGLKLSSNKNWKAVNGGNDNRKDETIVNINSMTFAVDCKEDLAGVIKVAADVRKKGFSEVLADIGKGNNPVADASNVNCHLAVEGLVWKEDDKDRTTVWTSRDGKREIEETVDRFIDMELESIEIGGRLNSVIDAIIGLTASCTTEEVKSKELDIEKEAADKASREEDKKEREDWLNFKDKTPSAE